MCIQYACSFGGKNLICTMITTYERMEHTKEETWERYYV